MRDYHDLTELGRARRLRTAVAAALEHYDLEPTRLRLLTNETNGIFRLDTGDGRKLVVRVGLGGEIAHSPGQVEAETEWLSALADDGRVAVPVPVPAIDGRRFVTLEVPGVPDPRNVVVFTWLAGGVLNERLTSENLHAYGALAARLHEHGAGHRPSRPEALARFDRVYPFDEPVILFDQGADLLPPGREALFREAWDRVGGAVARLLASGEPMRMLHGDLHPWNVMVSRQGLAAFDFEDVMRGWPIQDLGTLLWYLVRRDGYPERLANFRSGYESVAPWPEREAGELETFMISRYLVLGNDLLITPEWRHMAAEGLEVYEKGVRKLMEGPVSR